MRALLTAVLGLHLFAGAAFADHAEPSQAKKTSATLVSAYRQGNDPNTATQSDGSPACTPPIPAATFGCTFSPGGSGKFSAVLTGSVTDGNQDSSSRRSPRDSTPTAR